VQRVAGEQQQPAPTQPATQPGQQQPTGQSGDASGNLFEDVAQDTTK
jgi:hypothetical protein